MNTFFCLLIAAMMLFSCSALAEELPTADFEFAGGIGFWQQCFVEELSMFSNLADYPATIEKGDRWASYTITGVADGAFENVRVSFFGNGETYQIINHCAYDYADCPTAGFDAVLTALIAAYGEPVHTETTGTAYDTEIELGGTFPTGIAHAAADESITCSRYAQWMYLDAGAYQNVLIDASELTIGDAAHVIVRYTLLGE